MGIIHKIRQKLVNKEYEFTIPHFFEAMADDNLILSQHTLYNQYAEEKNITYDYGKCETCNTPLQEKYVKQDFWVRGELVVIENVPAGVCPRCGEKVVKADVGRRIAELLENSERIANAPRISVPAVRFDTEAEKAIV